MQNTTTPSVAATSKTAQNVITVSLTAKTFVKDLSASYSAPSKSKPDGMNATEREVLDAMVSFVEKHQYVTENQEVTLTDDNGNPEMDEDGITPLTITEDVEIDLFAIEINKVMAERLETSRANSKDSKIAELMAQLEELKKLQAAMTAPAPAAPAEEVAAAE